LARTPWAPGAAVLAAAARVVSAVARGGRSADDAFEAQDGGSERRAVRAVALGTLRWYLRLMPAIDRLLSRPDALAEPVRSLLAVSAHQVEYSRNAPELTVHAAVDAARLLGAQRATGLVNAVLRRFVAERVGLFAQVDQGLPARTAHPPWLVEKLSAAWPRQLESILHADNLHPPMTLRLNLSRTDRVSYLTRLREHDIDASEIQWMPSALTLTRPVNVGELPGFEEGAVSVQDAGAQLAASLLDARPGQRALDACAAPGGKSAHLLEASGGALDLTALDIDAARLALIAENLARGSLQARLVAADAREPELFWDGRPYDRILVDAPCSSTGVLRRHPDIRLLRRATDVAAFATLQLQILRSVWRLLAPGGRLVYSTCSLLPEENWELIEAFLGSEADVAVARMGPAGERVPGALPCRVGVQLLPGAEAGTDGFYYACLEKTTTGV
jgi:16S rRNA (cytosine967-C5)-methyltransferase